MKPAPVTLPDLLRRRLGDSAPAQWAGVGNMALLDEPLLGLISSRECPGHVMVETLERVPAWVSAGRVVASGFHSPLEQQVLRSLLRREGCAVKVLARGMTDYRPLPEERDSLAAGRLLVLTAFAPNVQRVTRETALERNRLVTAMAEELVVPYVAAGSPLAVLTI
ncbi:MAG: hypothetical protein MOGDAGHF_00711 [Rhodocyclaceae bacterium]|nr:hypothetical protein [Rhodocyclaceae bacterium]